jgi:hypothetical protein
MGRIFVLLIAGWAALLVGCAGSPKSNGIDSAAQTPVESTVALSETPWQYPIAAGIWYPGDGPLPEHAFKYYRVRCWPGCHDPNSAPQPHP